MKNIFSSDDEKLNERVFSQSLIISIISILLCIIALCSITYAWFTTNVSSGENVVESSTFALVIEVADGEGNAIAVTDNQDGTHSCTLENTGEYTVVLKMTDDTTASKGYCEITLNATEVMQTEPISDDSSIGVNPFTFTVAAADANTVITFESKWGISAAADIADGDTVGGIDEIADGDENGQDVDNEGT